MGYLMLHLHPQMPENWGQCLSDLGTSVSPYDKGSKGLLDTCGCLGKRKRENGWGKIMESPEVPRSSKEQLFQWILVTMV